MKPGHSMTLLLVTLSMSVVANVLQYEPHKVTLTGADDIAKAYDPGRGDIVLGNDHTGYITTSKGTVIGERLHVG